MQTTIRTTFGSDDDDGAGAGAGDGFGVGKDGVPVVGVVGASAGA